MSFVASNMPFINSARLKLLLRKSSIDNSKACRAQLQLQPFPVDLLLAVDQDSPSQPF